MTIPRGTVVFTSVGRQSYGFDVFSVAIPSDSASLSPSPERRLTDGVSLNYNAQFADDNDSIVHISERSAFPAIYISTYGSSKSEQIPTLPESIFHDRPVIRNNRVYFISAHEKPDRLFKSWNALYAIDRDGNNASRLTPHGVVDFSPAVSFSGKYIAVASYGSRLWDVQFQELGTQIVVFRESDRNKRVVVCDRGGWPSWAGDSTLYFHRKADDGFWSIFRVDVPENLDDFSGLSLEPVRVTPSGLQCMTPAAMQDGKRIVVATRRKGKAQRHIEIFDLESEKFYPVTEPINPNLNHYNPFVSLDCRHIGYHRFRGEGVDGENTIPNLEPVRSPIDEIRLLRMHGSFASFSPEGEYISYNAGLSQGLHIMRSDGSKRWTLIPRDRTAFYTSWSPTEPNVIYTTLGPVFAAVDKTVQIARVTVDPSHLTPDRREIPCDVKILTTEESGNNAFPACSPDGKSLVFRSGRSGHKNLYIMDAVDGEFKGNIRRVTEGECTDTMPAWSPKGDLIAFSSNRHNPGHSNPFSIYLVKPDGSDLRRVHFEGFQLLGEEEKSWMERTTHVAFSDDGEWLFFTSNLYGLSAEPVAVPRQIQPYGEIYMVRLDGSGLRRLSWNGYENGTPAFHRGHELLLQPEKKLLPLHKRSKMLIRTRTTNVHHVVDDDEHKLDGERLAAGQFNDVTWLNLN